MGQFSCCIGFFFFLLAWWFITKASLYLLQHYCWGPFPLYHRCNHQPTSYFRAHHWCLWVHHLLWWRGHCRCDSVRDVDMEVWDDAGSSGSQGSLKRRQVGQRQRIRCSEESGGQSDVSEGLGHRVQKLGKSWERKETLLFEHLEI